MLNAFIWLHCGWIAGIAVAGALGVAGRPRLAWHGVLGVASATLAGHLLAPAWNMPAGDSFSLPAAAVATCAAILLTLLGHLAAVAARRCAGPIPIGLAASGLKANTPRSARPTP